MMDIKTLVNSIRKRLRDWGIPMRKLKVCYTACVLCASLFSVLLFILPEAGREDLHSKTYSFGAIDTVGYHRYPLDIDFTSIDNDRELHFFPQINAFPFQYIINNEKRCSESDHVFLVILVKSSLNHQKNREMVRKTWGKDVAEKNNVKLVFLVGADNSEKKNSPIKRESDKHGDIVQMDFFDSFRNLTYKTMMGYKWVVQFCQNAEFVFIVDDDIYINLEKALRYLADIPKSKSLFSGCLNNVRNFPERDMSNKFLVTTADYPYDSYPPYLFGRYMLLSVDVVRKFQKLFPYIKYFWIEDVFIGIVASKISIMPEDNPHLQCEISSRVDRIRDYIAIHGLMDLALTIDGKIDIIANI